MPWEKKFIVGEICLQASLRDVIVSLFILGMRNGVSQFQLRTPMAICGQRTHFFTGIATKTWCGHHFRRVSSETECQNSSLEVSLFGI